MGEVVGQGRSASYRLADDALRGRVVVVTGGSMGIGRACAEAVLAAGGRVVLAARGEAELAAAAETLGQGQGQGRVAYLATDVGDEGQVDALFSFAAERFGAPWGVIHAAAVLGPIGRMDELDAGEWWAALRINLHGTFLVARAAVRALRATGAGGRIVLLSGGGATGPLPRYTAYASSKAAVVRLTETLAHEVAGDGIAVNALAPGFVATRIHEGTLAAGVRAGADYLEHTKAQLREGAAPPELAGRTAAFLVSAEAVGITGRLVSAVWDDWADWPSHRDAIDGSDLFTLRRIVPRDRGEAWQ